MITSLQTPNLSQPHPPDRYNSSHYLRYRRIYYIIGSAVKFPYMVLIHRHLVDVYKHRYYMVLHAMQVCKCESGKGAGGKGKKGDGRVGVLFGGGIGHSIGMNYHLMLYHANH